jgi:integrase
VRKKISVPSAKNFAEACLASGMTSPSSMRDAYEKQWKKSLTADAFEKAIRRLGISSERRKQLAEEAKKQTVCRDISEYRQYQAYAVRSETRITTSQRKRQLDNMRRLWEVMDCSNPEEWEEQDILTKLKQVYPLVDDGKGGKKFEHPHTVKDLLTAVNTMFPGILTKGWYSDYTREPGELKDYFTFEEWGTYKSKLCDTPTMPRIGWLALNDSQVNMGCREGTKKTTGILSLRWENINYETRRCSINDKGGRGKAARLWKNIPLDLFPHLNGWWELMEWHKVQNGYYPTNEHHATGRAFPFAYTQYLNNFHDTRHKCGGRIAADLDTMRPHIIRRTHAQWLVKLGIPLERICGQFPDGRFGVGWDNPLVLLRYYVTLESDEEQEILVKAQKKMIALGIAPLSAWEKSSLWREHTFLPRLEESSSLLCRNVE